MATSGIQFNSDALKVQSLAIQDLYLVRKWFLVPKLNVLCSLTSRYRALTNCAYCKHSYLACPLPALCNLEKGLHNVGFLCGRCGQWSLYGFKCKGNSMVTPPAVWHKKVRLTFHCLCSCTYYLGLSFPHLVYSPLS